MKLFSELNNETFELYAAKHYRNEACLDIQEFKEDVARFKYVLRLLRRYNESGIIQERLVLNHIIVIYNVFEIRAANRMIFYKIEPELWPSLKPFLIYLNYLPEDDNHSCESIDLNIAKKLQTI
jgi:hypothetical protein|tara:strand:+ start:444 stop:815 length:372 start_codon:yes stop_codon:yes gene_type:complete